MMRPWRRRRNNQEDQSIKDAVMKGDTSSLLELRSKVRNRREC